MGHVKGDPYLGPGGTVAAAGGMAETIEQTGPRQLEAVRRGAVRQRKPEQQVVPSTWEHLEMAFDDGPDRVWSLSLDTAGVFHAVVREQPHEADSSDEATIISAATGTWRSCRRGVELLFEDSDLLELYVGYSLRRGCLVADTSELPDGLAQEYSRCSSDILISPERSMLIDRMLADASTISGAGLSSENTSVVVSESVAGFPRQTRDTALRRKYDNDDSDSDTNLCGRAPVGIIEEKSDSDDEDSPPLSVPHNAEDKPHMIDVADRVASCHVDPDEEYLDDFEDDGSDADDA